MSCPTASTLWPSAQLPSGTKQLLNDFFSLVDNKAEDAGQKLATNVFAADGIFFATSGNFQGSTDIAKSRDMAWETVLSRHHELKKVYCNDTEGIDLMLTGAVTVRRDASQESHEFVARCLLHTPNSGAPKIQHYQVLIPVSKESYIPLLKTERH